MMVNPQVSYTNISAQMLGMVQHVSNSIFLALIVVYLIKSSGTDYLFLKGLSIGGFLYFVIYGVIGRYIVPVEILQPDLSTSAVYALGNFVYGITVVYLVGYLAKRNRRSA